MRKPRRHKLRPGTTERVNDVIDYLNDPPMSTGELREIKKWLDGLIELRDIVDA